MQPQHTDKHKKADLNAGDLQSTPTPSSAKSSAPAPVRYKLRPRVLLGMVTLLIQFVIWSSAYQFISVARTNAQNNALNSTRDLADLYEFQVLRSIREIDQTLKLIKYSFEKAVKPSVLDELKARDLLPYESIFAICITDPQGATLSDISNCAAKLNPENAQFQQNLRSGALAIGLPHKDAKGEWRLQFARQLQNSSGSMAGIVWVSVAADYFVSGYDDTKLHEHGLLGLLGDDGIFRVRRSGTAISAGDALDYTAIAAQLGNGNVELITNDWDQVRRYSALHALFGYPVAVVVGIAEIDQNKAVNADIRFYLAAAAISAVVCQIMIILLWRLGQHRRLVAKERLAHAEQIEHLAFYDGLTGLPNRSMLNRLLPPMIAQAQQQKNNMSIFFIDLDGFKQINDTLGHHAGDELLQQVAQRIKNCLRTSDIVARLGGDEFVVLLPEIEDTIQAGAVAEKILNAVDQPFILQGKEFRVTASIGISVFPSHGLDEETLAKNADIAMYRAKEQGKNRAEFYSSS